MDLKNEAVLFAAVGSPAILDLLPCAVGVWSLDREFCALNSNAKKLLGAWEDELQCDRLLWLNRVDPRDREHVSQAWEKLQFGQEGVCLDYRFFSRVNQQPVWLREVAATCRNRFGVAGGVISCYTDISDLKAPAEKSTSEKGFEKVLKSLIHDVQNNLQTIRMEIDLLKLDQDRDSDFKRMIHAIDRANLSMQDLSDYFTPPELFLRAEKAEIILDELVREMEKELNRQGIRLELLYRRPLPQVRVDSRQFRNALERVLGFCQALLKEGGKLEIEADLKQIDGEEHVELKFSSDAHSSLEMDEKEVFRPFLRVNNYRVGLGMALADQIMERHHGKIFFRKENSHRGTFTVLLNTR